MLQIGSNIDMLPLQAAILRQPILWGMGGPADSIILRGPGDDGKTTNYPAMDWLWQARPHVFGIMSRMEGEELGDVEIRKINPANAMQLEPEMGFSTYVFVLNCAAGLVLQQQLVRPGDVWAVEKGEVLSNNSADAAFVLICTLRPAAPSTYIPQVYNGNKLPA